MATVATPISSTLQVIVETGLDENNKVITKTRSYPRVKPSAQDDDIMDVAVHLAGLQMHPVNSIRKVVVSDLVNEG
jgi:hypothetical protein